VNINVPLMDAMQVPTYTRYLKDIINNKWPLPTTEVVKLIEACSAAIRHQLLEKKKDPGCPTIRCSIGTQNFDKALCDLGASVMPKAVFDRLNYTVLAPTLMQLQLVDSTLWHPEGTTEAKVSNYLSNFIHSIWDTMSFGEHKADQEKYLLHCTVAYTEHALNLK